MAHTLFKAMKGLEKPEWLLYIEVFRAGFHQPGLAMLLIGGCEGESLLDVVRLLFFLFLIAVSYSSVALLYASVEMRFDEEEVFVVNWLWW